MLGSKEIRARRAAKGRLATMAFPAPQMARHAAILPRPYIGLIPPSSASPPIPSQRPHVELFHPVPGFRWRLPTGRLRATRGWGEEGRSAIRLAHEGGAMSRAYSGRTGFYCHSLAGRQGGKKESIRGNTLYRP